MESLRDTVEHESNAKRIKLDYRSIREEESRKSDSFSHFSTNAEAGISVSEVSGILPDCGDSGYKNASAFEATPTPSEELPHTSHDNFSETYIHSSFGDNSLHDSQDSTSTPIEDEEDDEDDDDNASTVSHLSDISGLSDLSGLDWKPMASNMIWVQRQMQNGIDPRTVLNDFGVDVDQIPQYMDDLSLWKIIINILTEPPRRNKLSHINTLDDVLQLLKGAKNIIVLTGAGVSVSCGIPDFRSKDGIYSRLAIDFPDLPDPHAMFDITYFSQDPRPFFKFARDIYPGKFQPSPCHRFIKLLETQNKLLRNYSQNIDTLEKIANIERVVECHGSFATATCTKCGHRVTADAIREIVLAQNIPLCEVCHKGKPHFIESNKLQRGDSDDFRDFVSSGIMKPDIVFFGEGLPNNFHEAMSEDKAKCDLLLVIGSSLKVRPVALIPNSLPPDVPQILINREPLSHCHFDVELLGDCDVIINQICHLLAGSWKEIVYDERILKLTDSLMPLEENQISCSISADSEIEISRNTDISELNKIEGDISCNSNLSTNCSSLLAESDSESNCSCSRNEMSIESTDDRGSFCCTDIRSVKERHISIDSARDSGIGENSNFTDLETKYDDTSDDSEGNVEIDNCNSDSTSSFDFRQSSKKSSLADRLPLDSYWLLSSSRYVFPGAEVFQSHR